MDGKEKLIYAAILGAAIGDALPTVADAIYFNQQQQLKEKLAKGEITPAQYWHKEALYYYTTNSLYWLIVGAVIYNVKGGYHAKLKAGLFIIGGSAVIGVIAKNIQKDEKFYSEHKFVKTNGSTPNT